MAGTSMLATDVLARSLAEGIVVLDAELRIELVNAEGERILRCPAARMVGRHIDDLASTWALRDRGPYAVSKMRHHLMRRLPYRNDDAFVVAGDEGITHVSLVMTPVRLDGLDSGAVISLWDVTELKRAEHLVRESEARFRAVFDLAPAGMVRVALDGTVAGWNRAFGELIGERGDTLRASTLSALVHPSDADHVAKLLAAQQEDPGAANRAELRYVRNDGAEVWTSTSLALVRGRNRQADFVVAVVEDLTARRRLEVERRHAQKLEAVARLSGGLAHELNTPIQFIQDNVRFLADAFASVAGLLALYQQGAEVAARAAAEAADLEFLAQEVPTASAEALAGLGRMAEIIRAMKAFGEPDTGTRAPADLNEALRSALVVASPEIQPVAEVELDLGELPLVPCDVADMNQVFLHLLTNAAHAIGEVSGRGRPGLISVGTAACDGEVVVAISDSGPGIPDEVARRMFDPFFTTKPVGQGAGQGLTLAHAVVVGRHGGRLAFETRMGQGTTFRVHLPVAPLANAQGG